MNEDIQFDNVWFSFDHNPVIKEARFTIRHLDFVSIIGPNGAGKTTLARLMLGLLQPDKGQIRVLGKQPYQTRQHLGYVPQYSRFDPQFPVTVKDVVLMGRLSKPLGFYSREDKEAAEAAMQEVGMEGFENRAFSALSGGQRQRVLIARALSGDPDILILDEPTSNVDTAVELRLRDLLEKLHERLTIIMITHDLGFVAESVNTIICVNVWVKRHAAHEVTPEMIQRLYGAPVHMVDHNSHLGENHA